MSKRRWIDRLTEEAAKTAKPAPWARDGQPVVRVRTSRDRDAMTDAA